MHQIHCINIAAADGHDRPLSMHRASTYNLSTRVIRAWTALHRTAPRESRVGYCMNILVDLYTELSRQEILVDLYTELSRQEIGHTILVTHLDRLKYRKNSSDMSQNQVYRKVRRIHAKKIELYRICAQVPNGPSIRPEAVPVTPGSRSTTAGIAHPTDPSAATRRSLSASSASRWIPDPRSKMQRLETSARS